MSDINVLIRQLVNYGINKELVAKEDEIYTINRILEVLKIDEYNEPENVDADTELEEILSGLLDFAYDNGVMEENSVAYRDLMDTKIMGCLVPAPSVVISKFNELYKESPEKATEFYYNFSRDTDYI